MRPQQQPTKIIAIIPGITANRRHAELPQPLATPHEPIHSSTRGRHPSSGTHEMSHDTCASNITGHSLLASFGSVVFAGQRMVPPTAQTKTPRGLPARRGVERRTNANPSAWLLVLRCQQSTTAHAVPAVVTQITIPVPHRNRTTVITRRRICLECRKLLAANLRRLACFGQLQCRVTVAVG